ncbi:hypothetical protein IMSHALPRED_008307 [Imshaugia aleurites]|uniref:Uncharacterized protein n=1 Tax=Imshaugia aleurites TaxID=172621 RepID=A0A8H3FUE0_9LECA|nr:hypothetical protein IMSHALPRED_008307 [Imshaugia aleurites]
MGPFDNSDTILDLQESLGTLYIEPSRVQVGQNALYAAEACAFLATRDRKFDAEKELEILEMEYDISAPGDWSKQGERLERPCLSRRGPDQSAEYGLPAPFDVTARLPPLLPCAKNNQLVYLSSLAKDTIDEEPEETEETSEAIARRIESMDVADGKTNMRNVQRRRAKVRANEVASDA